MKKFALCCGLIILCAFNAIAQVTTTSLDSYKLGEKRNVRLYVPEDYSAEKVYPLIVVLDADYLFDLVVGNAKFYTYKDEMPKSIIVGIDQNETRYEDCFYSDENGLPDKKGNAFFEFIGMELIPMIEKNYNLANFKAIVGHGVTANFADYYLFKDNPLFNAYVILSPTFAPTMESNTPKRLSELQEMIFYYLATGEHDAKESQQRINVFNNQMKGYTNDNLHYYYDNFTNASHFSVASYGIPKALDQFFTIYKPISVEEYKKDVLAYEGPVIDYLTNKYNTIETLFGFKKQVSLNDMMAIYAATKKKEDLESLNELSKIAKKEYPDTMLGFFWEAEYFEQMGEPKKAMRTYEKAFGMPEIDFATKDLALERIDALKADFGW
ncbi:MULTISPECIES: alpha/beta hydrolase [Galbibacter]|uniref:Alpha/beta hydrolase-fold protein n=1 Tax=Galbibacter pacificus TaxID=2996052 RepID=A0ABT6FSJ5_9FLAO|nr:alpha/beta hydrolase-fold protein [Galbibacter pacificus]MDG3582643.1 alpha/beta hydrolase-fold protein [Galbibacter pacificus]MDG3586238.1 alpha/beta hydrolase-fold protein [Galbibacter pacificus]